MLYCRCDDILCPVVSLQQIQDFFSLFDHLPNSHVVVRSDHYYLFGFIDF